MNIRTNPKEDPEAKFLYHMKNLTLQKRIGLASWVGLVIIWVLLRML